MIYIDESVILKNILPRLQNKAHHLFSLIINIFIKSTPKASKFPVETEGIPYIVSTTNKQTKGPPEQNELPHHSYLALDGPGNWTWEYIKPSVDVGLAKDGYENRIILYKCMK